MTQSRFTLDLLGPIILETRDRLRRMEERLERVENERLVGIEADLRQLRDESTVTSAMVMRHMSEPIAWGAMDRMLKRLTDRVEALEQRSGEKDA
jgi:hypothetical protein